MYFKTIITSLMGLFLLVSCNKEDNEPQTENLNRSELLVGKWKTTYGGPSLDSLVPVDPNYGFIDEYKKDGTGTSTYLYDSSVDPFKWVLSKDQKIMTQTREYEGEPDVFDVEFYSFERDKFIIKDTSFGEVTYGVFERVK